MDRFVIRNPKPQAEKGPAVKKKGSMGQATLFSLKRVVVLEDIKRWKCILELPSQTKENLLEALSQLKKKIPSEEVIRTTKIGDAKNRTYILVQTSGEINEPITQAGNDISGEAFCTPSMYRMIPGEAVEGLQTHSDSEVSELAKEVYSQWETFLREKRCKPTIEVRSDPTTEKLRNNARRMLCEALEKEVGDSLAECIEREAFHQSSRLINVHYRRTVRTLVFALKHKPEIRSQVKDGHLPVNKLVQTHKK